MLFLLLATLLTATFNPSVFAQDSKAVHSESEVRSLIRERSVRKRIASFESLLTSKGLSARTDGGFAGEDAWTDQNGRKLRAKMVLIPFATVADDIGATILAVTLESEDGEIQQEFVTYSIGDPACDCESSGEVGKAGELEGSVTIASLPWNDIAQLIQLIRNRNWLGIRNWIGVRLARGITDAIIAGAVRSAFESQGYYCPNPPWWVPFKSIWYLTTCARRAS